MNKETQLVLQLYQGQANLTDKIWWYFATVSLGIVGFATASDATRQSTSGMLVLTFTYLAFAVGNAISLHRAQNDLHVFTGKIAELVDGDPIFENRFKAFPVKAASWFHGILATGVVVTLVYYLWQSLNCLTKA